VLALLDLLVDKDGQLNPDHDDPIVAGACVTGAGLQEAS
jgi:NAD/NADP transhydrogenase alpha subunit